jgi:hypothetical protein
VMVRDFFVNFKIYSEVHIENVIFQGDEGLVPGCDSDTWKSWPKFDTEYGTDNLCDNYDIGSLDDKNCPKYCTVNGGNCSEECSAYY